MTRLTAALSDRYQIERELGSGGMATVYLARDLKHEREVALKVLRPELGAVLGAERFLAEIKITARLDHPHILTLIDSGASDGLFYYVLPYVRGESLRDKLTREKQLGLDEALTITRQVASALDYAHRQGVVHRDIKPENILLQEGEAMLADFGIALAVKEAGGNRLTETGLSLGTPQYMSPEQATGDRQLDARSDVYSLAAVLYEMLAGEPPVTGPTVQAVIAKLLTERPTHLRVVRDTIPEGIDTAVARALAKVPADRFAGAGEFAAALAAGGPRDRGTGGPKRWTPKMVAGTLALTVLASVAAVVAEKFTRRAVRVVQPDRVQVTFTGNARTPALSPDGQRLAYSTRQCTAEGYCTVDVVVQDVGGAGATTVLRGWLAVWSIEWTSDGRFLQVEGFQSLSGNWGPFSVPSLGGGQARFLGCCSGIVGAGDTVLVARAMGGDSLFWIRWVTMADGVAHDSIPFARSPGSFASAALLPGGRVLLGLQDAAGHLAVTLDRAGALRDSMRFSGVGERILWHTADGRMLFIAAVSEANPAEYALLAVRIAEDGRFAARPDTVLAQLQGDATVGLNGVLAVSSGPSDYEVWLMRRDQPSSMRFTQRRLAAGTAQVGGLVNPAGDRVMLWRRVIQGGRGLLQWSVMSADSGPETPVGPPLDVADWEWNWDGTGLIAGVRRGDSVAIGDVDVPSGRFRPRFSVERTAFQYLWALPGDGLLMVDGRGQAVRAAGGPGPRDTVFTFPESEGTQLQFTISPDGREAVSLGWDAPGDSVIIRRLSLADGRLTRLASIYADGWGGPQWLSDGTIVVPIRETQTTITWYRMPAAGGRPVRVGSPPRAGDASFRLSRDGRTVIARVTTQRPDVHLIRNFAELLPR